MGRIKKLANPKHEATISPFFADLTRKAAQVPLVDLPSTLATLPAVWSFPRGDLYHWINVLNRFDDILALVIDRYDLKRGPQKTPFGRSVLKESWHHDFPNTTLSDQQLDAELDSRGYGPEGDRELVEAILRFSLILLEKCGNRSLYSSSDRLDDLLNTTSNSLLRQTLRVALALAQRYHARQRHAASSQSLLSAHYNINLDKLQKLAAPFPRPNAVSRQPLASPSPAVLSRSHEAAPPTKHNANDMITLLRESDEWEEWGSVRAVYYPSGAATTEQARPAPDSPAHEPATSHTPSTPTPLRRSATLPTPRQRRASGAEDLPTSQFTTPVSKPEEAPRGSKVVTIPVSRVASSSLTDLTASTIPNVPNESEYDFLHRLRVAHSLVKSDATREEILDIRILAIANLAYVHSEANFQQKVLQQDADQPKRLQLVYQLAELAHLGASGDIRASRLTQTLALNALEALARQKSRAADVCAALNVNVNHGVLMFLTRKAITEVSKEEDEPTESEEWRDALFALLRTLPSSGSRTPETLVAAGLMSMFVDILNQRTEKARRMFPRVLEFLDTFVHAVRDALGTLASARGFDAVSELIGHETKSALENVHQGRGLPAEFRTPSVDYEIAYFQQQSLRWLFRFVNHIMQHSGGGFDRLLRNLIDSPPLLTALRLVYENANVFGSHVWSGAVNILSSFIHNEPTSYAVIAEAGLSKSLLESVATRDLSVPPLPEPIETDEAAAQAQPVPAPSEQPAAPPRVYYLTRSPDQKLAGGILPASEAMSSIPQAFGAICLNTSGMELFQSSGALDTYFEIFESPAHVKCMKDDSTLVRSLGTTFDELVRHHPALKPSVMSAVIVMVARVGLLCKRMAWTAGAGTRLWRRSDDGNGLEPVGPKSSWLTDIGVPFDKAVESGGAFSYPHLQDATLPNGGKMALGDVSNLPDPENLPLDANGRDQWGLGVDDYMYPVVRFLGAFFENQTNCTQFIEAGGVEFVLDFATLPSLPHNFRVSKALVEFVQLVHMMTETKPQLVLPSLVQRTQDVVDCLSDFWREPSPNGFFTSLTKPESDTAARDSPTAQLATTKGTYLAQHLVAAYVLTGLLHEVYTPPMYQTRPSQQTSAFSQVNLAERYSAIVTSLGKLHAACVWEDIALQKNIPKRWVEATEVRQDKQGTDDSRNVSGHRDHAGSGHRAAEGDRPGTADGAQGGDDGQGQIDTTVQNDPAFRNVEKLRYILTTLPSFITRFFNSLGHGVIGKRRIETYQRQNASMVADAIADAMLHQLQLEVANQAADIQDKFSYLIFILSSLSQLLFETPAERTLSECPTLLLLAFKKKGGFKVLRDFSQIFVDVINQLVSSPSQALGDSEGSARIASAYGGLRIILTCFAEIASPTYVVESNQTQALASPERERDRPDYFHPSQFLVDLRMEIVPMVRELWNSPFVDKASTVIVKCMVDILRSVLEGDREAGAARRSDPPQYVNDIPRKTFTIHRDRLATLRDRGYDQDLAREALYRCNNALTAAEEYCKARSWIRPPPRCPPPSQDLDPVRGAGSGEASEETPSGDTPSDRAASLARFLAQASAARSAEEGAESSEGGTQNADGENRIDIVARALNHILADTEGRGNDSNQGSSSDTQSQQRRRQVAATIDDLDSERDAIRENLIERCLDVLNVHHDVTFELSDLIQAAMRRHHDIDGFRREVGETLIQSLVSLQMEENFRSSGKKIAAYANLLALVIQDESNFRATLGDLKDYFVTLLGFIKITPSDKDTDETAPWIAHVLLVLERLLSDDAQPPQIRWNPPPLDGSESNEEPAQLEEPLLSLDDKTKLFDALLEILPRIGRDTTLALSVCRILAVLTRSRSIAVRMGEKRNLQRLFVMMKQVCGSMDEKLQSSFMLILRHVIEDEETIRQIMRSEIVAHFESRTARQTETSNYVRHMYHLVLRAPELFVEVTNEKLKIQRYDPHQRPQVLTLKTTEKNESSTESKDSAEQPRESVEGGQPSDGKEKGKTTELKPPVVENPDGVIHYLLSELLSYKDVDDKEPPQENTDVSSTDPSGSRMDVDVPSEEASSASSTADGAARGQKKSDKPSFKPEDHPIYIYRCFLLQCLTELLASYNRTKVEFINFSRKADPLATTPSKPRGGVLNYLLNALVPVGTLEHEESLAFKKRSNVSSLAINVLVALCTKTGEFGAPNRRRSHEDEEDEPALTFVRRFTLEHALKAYKDAMASTEPLDVKYSRLMCLAMLFDKMLGHSIFGGDNNNNNNNFDSWNFESTTRQMAKTMFEKHFISALTSSIADIDLNFPSARRVIKYILRPLNKLTQTAVYLSETSSITLPEEADEDKISSATSVSDLDDDREETPDLFRHSTLGMLEPRHDEEETSEEEESEEDDEMYDDEYGDEMDYDEEMPEDDGEVVSEEDEDLDGPIEGLPGDSGMDIEVLIDDDGEHDEEDDEDDEDDDDDEGDDEDDMHDDEEDEIMAGEITGDHDNDSLAEDREDEWESEDMSGDNEEAEMLTQFEDELADIRQADRDGDSQRFDDLLRVINEASGGDVFRVTNMDDNAPDDVDDDEGNEDEDEEDEMDEIEEDMDDMDDDRGSYDGFDEEDIEPWGGWDGDEPPLPGHQRFRAGTAWGVPGMSGRGGIVAGQPYRLHRSQINSRPSDVGTNPLLIRSNRQTEGQTQTRASGNEIFTDWISGLNPANTASWIPFQSPASFVNAVMQAIDAQRGPGFDVITRDGLQVHVDRRALQPGLRFQDLFGMPQQAPSRPRDDPTQAIGFTLAPTATRWREEASLLFGNSYVEKTQRVVNSILRLLVPPAIEEEKRRQKELEEERKRREEERAERERLERIAREEEERERKRKEEEEAARRREERERHAEARGEEADEHMEDVSGPAEGTTAPAEAGPAEPPRRIHTTIRGRQVDITGMEIDPEYLEALPEELREEVIMQQVAEQRSQAFAAGEEPTEIDQEFLDALPPELREEMLQQEAADRRRREREAARRQAAANGGPVAEEMDTASFLATLDPQLRQVVLADQSEEVLATLDPALRREALALQPGRRLAQAGDTSGRLDQRQREESQDTDAKKPQRRQIIQMLDKAGVATLLRLMFMPLQGNARHQLHDILHNVCENRQNRMEVINLLLSILQDGSTDVSAVERSFAHLSLRAKTPPAQKTPQSAKRPLPSSTSMSANSEITPLMVVQQCLGTLSFLTQYNPHISWFFLTEHESASALKLKALRKGKGKEKETRANRFALNALLSLLDRKLVMESPTCMEQLASLLSTITQPLTLLLRREKERQEAENKGKEPIRPEGEESTEEPAQTAAPSGQDSEMTEAAPPTQEEAAGETSEQPKAEDDKNKKRTIEPPVVPDYNLQLVVRILAARECNGKTFRDTLSAINNLSAIPRAKDVIGRELISQAQGLSEAILLDLEELIPHVQQAKTGTDMQGLALAKFSPPSSDQAKLLRVLTALDYLFDPSRVEKLKGAEPESAPKEDMLRTLYESATFGPLWSKLSECLTVVRQKENMLNVATTLLPLIEALMVVCKNTPLKDAPVSRRGREGSVSSPPQESGGVGSNMERLFFSFTEEHRKILNELVRQNPRLMSGTFSLLVKNPKVLEFDNKRNYFTRRLHMRGAEARHSHPPLQLSVRRDQVFLDSFKSLYFKTADEVKYGKLNVRFHGEEGIDAGGVTREWFQVLARGMFNPNYALFIPVASDRTTFHPNRLSGVNSEHLMFFKFIGRIIGKALYEGRVLDCHFSRAVYKSILGKPVSIKDMETLDLDYYKSLVWMLENDITDIITETFAIETDDFGEKQIIDLIPNGRNIPVTQENKEEYVQRVVEYKLVGSVKEQLEHFLKGFHDIIPADLISIFNEQELELLISGLPEIDVDDWRNNTEYHNYSPSSPQIQWFWRAVRSFDKEERAKLLQFVTGTSKVPLNGFKELEGMNGFSKFNIHRDYGDKDRLPSSHTCFNQLDLPEYESYEELRSRLYTAMTQGSEYFGFA